MYVCMYVPIISNMNKLTVILTYILTSRSVLAIFPDPPRQAPTLSETSVDFYKTRWLSNLRGFCTAMPINITTCKTTSPHKNPRKSKKMKEKPNTFDTFIRLEVTSKLGTVRTDLRLN